MRVLVINLATATARMAFQRAQMAALGLDWERVDAVTPATLSAPADDARWQRWERPLKPVEIAVLESHCTVWERIRAANAPSLILEDDALLSIETPAFLRAIEGEHGVDHVTLEVRSRRKLVGSRHPILPMRRLYQDRTGAAAYVLWPSGARTLLARAAARPGLADGIIGTAYEMKSWQSDPALAVQMDRCSDYGVRAPVAGESSTEQGASPSGRAIHRFRRIVAQVCMGFRQLSKFGLARREWIGISTNWKLPTPPAALDPDLRPVSIESGRGPPGAFGAFSDLGES